MNTIEEIEAAQLRENIPDFSPGDTVRVHVRVVEGNRERVQLFEGVVIARKGGSGARASFTVRKISFGVGVERIFPLHAPIIQDIEVIRRGDVRRDPDRRLRRLRHHGLPPGLCRPCLR